MAYSLRYYKDLEQPNGQIVRLEIFEKDGTAPAVQIGRVVQSLSLDIQGGADAIDAPIVKTSLKMTFVDAADLHDGKCGDWQEFYTADATKWKVVLYAGPSRGSYTKIWGGFVTPDSYSEQLRYRGSVTIIARDNIGHMQDFPFDMDGNADKMITLRELVDAAWAKIESPMTLDWLHEEQEATYLRCNGIDAIDTYLNVSAFEGMNYYDAVEKALYAYGLVMRYNGRNIVSVMSLRDLPKQGKAQKPSTVAPTFIAGAEREFAPAVKRIEESVKYEFGEGVRAKLANGIGFTGAQGTCPFLSTNVFGETTTKSIPVHPIAQTSGEGWSNIAGSTLFFDPKRYTITDARLKEDAERMIFLAGNTDGSRAVTYRKSIYCSPFRIEIGFGRVVTREGSQVSYCYGFAQGTENQGVGSIRVKKVDCYIAAEQGSTAKYYDGAEWGSEVKLISLTPEDNKVGVDVGFDGLSGNATIVMTIENIIIDAQRDYSDGGGMYVPIQSLEFVAADALSLCETNNVNTNYNADNNVILSHNPEIAPALNEVPFPNVIKNGIYVKSGSAYLPAKEWAWSGGTAQQMAVYNHLQLLCYHAQPNNVISGDIVNVDFLNMERIYSWGGSEHILVSGSYDFISGRIAGAVLREFAWYDSMWGNVSGTPQGAEQNSRTVAEGSGRASNTSTYNNETTVNIGETSGGSGVTTLIGLEDTSINNQFTGQSLVYDTIAGKWINKVIGVGGSAFTHRGYGYSYDYNIYYENPNLDATDFIRVGKSLKGRMFLGGTSYPNYSIIFFDKDKNIITRYFGDEGKARVQDFELTNQIPSNAVFFVATNYNAHRAESYIELDSYLYVDVVNQIEKAVADVPAIKTNIGDSIAEKATVLSTKQLSMGIKCEAGNVRFKVSLLSGSLPLGWNLYRYVDGKFNETRLANEVPFGQAVDITVPEGDDGVWLFIFQGSADAMVEYEVTTGVNRSVAHLTEDVVQQGNDIVGIQNDLREYEPKLNLIPQLQQQVVDIIGDLGSETRKSSKNRIVLWVDNTPDISEYEFRISSDNPATSKYNLYYASADHSSLSLMNKDVAIGAWVKVNKDSAKPSLYIYDAGVADGTTSEREYFIEFRATESLAKDVDDLKNRESGAESWKGKTIVCFGDSLTEFKDYDNNKTYADYIHDITEAEVINIGIGGSQFRRRTELVANPTNYNQAYAALDIVSMVEACCMREYSKQIAATNYLTTNDLDRNDEIIARMQAIQWNEVDVVTIFAGTNDWNNGYGAWGDVNSNDISTTFGAINEIIRMLLSTYPHLIVYWFTPTVRWMADSIAGRTDATFSDTFVRGDATLQEFSARIERVVKNHHLPVCDMYNTLGWTKYNFSEYFSDTDGTHPRKGKGTEQIAKKIVAFIGANKIF